MGRVREEKRRRKKIKKEKVRRKKIQVREKVGKPRNTVFFPMFCRSGGSKSRLAKAAGAEPAGQMRGEKVHTVVAYTSFSDHLTLGALLEVEMSKKCTQLWREAHVEVKMHKAPHVRTTFGS